MGGLARKATLLDDLHSNIKNFYVVDAGNLFFKQDVIDPGITTEVALINADIIVKSFNEMGCTAFSPGSKDFAGGKNVLLSISEIANFPFVSCNIYNKSNNQLLFDSYIIKHQNGIRIAFIGLSSIFDSQDVVVKNPLEALEDVLVELNSKSDITLLLFSSNDTDIKAIQNKR